MPLGNELLLLWYCAVDLSLFIVIMLSIVALFLMRYSSWVGMFWWCSRCFDELLS